MLRPLPTSLPKTDRPSPARAQRADDLTPLLQGAIRGEEAALRTLIQSLSPKVLGVVRRIFGRHDPNVEDVSQEALFAFIEALPSFQGRCSVTHFACRIAVQVSMNVRRAEATKMRGALRPSDEPVESLGASFSPAEDEVDRQAAATAVRALLITLPVEQAEALVLHTVAGFTVAEIANSSGARHETVRSRLRLARAALRRKLEGSPTLALVEQSP